MDETTSSTSPKYTAAALRNLYNDDKSSFQSLLSTNFSAFESALDEIITNAVNQEDYLFLTNLVVIVGLPIVLHLEDFFHKLSKQAKSFQWTDLQLINSLFFTIEKKLEPFITFDPQFEPWEKIRTCYYEILKHQESSNSL
jgi:hypothetical protein